ncbi:MAG: hypothetical protein AB7P04_08205, partial [Bacteriovoracia bacterium]
SQCHGTIQSPQFAVASAEQAYSVVLSSSIVNFGNIPGSKIVVKSGDNHCGSVELCGTPARRQQMQDAVTHWWEDGECVVQGACDGGAPAPSSRIRLSQKQIPAGLNATFQVLPAWNLSEVSPQLAGYTFTIEVSRPNVPGTSNPTNAYLFRNPRITFPGGATNGVRVADFIPVINNLEIFSASTYTTVDTTVMPPTTQNVSTLMLNVAQAQGPGVDTVGFAFVVIEAAQGCKNFAGFSANVFPPLRTNCFSCHTGTGQGVGAFNLGANTTTPDQTKCLLTRMKTNPANPPASQLIVTPLGPLGGHPNVGGVSGNPAFFTDWQTWIGSEL